MDPTRAFATHDSKSKSHRRELDALSSSALIKEMAKQAAVTVKDMYWTIGAFGIVTICEAPDDETATALSLSIAARGYVRAQTLRAFSAADISKVLDKKV